MTTQPQHVSVTLPVSQAMETVKRLLFRPFDVGKWFTIGFCAWLARLGQSGFHGGGSFNNGAGNNRQWHGWSDAHEGLHHARTWILHNLGWLLPLTIAVVLLVLGLWMLLLWLSSRGKFMFLHCVAVDKAEVIVPWRKFGREANSLMLFRLIIGLCWTVLTLPLVIWAIIIGLGMIEREAAAVGAIFALIGLGFVSLFVSFASWFVSWFATEFVVPIQFLRGGRCVAAWRTLLGLMRGNIAEFVLYVLFRIVIAICIFILVVFLVLITCCCAGCLLALPYLGTVFFLPVLVFVRAYSAHYLAQFGPDWDVFAVGAKPNVT